MLAVDDVQPVAASVVQVGDARERFGQWREGKAGKVLSISVIGDSYSAGQDFYLNKLVQRLAGEAGFAGPGYVGFNHGAALGVPVGGSKRRANVVRPVDEQRSGWRAAIQTRGVRRHVR